MFDWQNLKKIIELIDRLSFYAHKYRWFIDWIIIFLLKYNRCQRRMLFNSSEFAIFFKFNLVRSLAFVLGRCIISPLAFSTGKSNKHSVHFQPLDVYFWYTYIAYIFTQANATSFNADTNLLSQFGAHDQNRTGEPLPYQGSALPTELHGLKRHTF